MDAQLLDVLNTLHDGILRELRFDSSNPRTRTLSLLVRCDPRPNAMGWEDRVVHVRAHDVLLFRCTAWTRGVGYEVLDQWTDGLSDVAAAELATLGAGERGAARIRCTATFRSGSQFELACQQLTAEVEP
jgi:hypothetical protein